MHITDSTTPNTVLNPHLQQLKQRPGLLNAAGNLTVFVPWVLLAGLLLLLILLANYRVGYPLWQVVALGAFALTVAVPFIASAAAAQLVAQDLENGHYAAVAMTNLSDYELTTSYFYAGLHRVRGAAWLMSSALVIAGVGSLWTGLRAEMALEFSGLLLLWLLLPVQLAGLCGGVVALGVMLALRYRGPTVSRTAVPLLALAITLAELFLLVRALLYSSVTERAAWLFWVHVAVVVVVPYVLMIVSLRLMQRWARCLAT